VAANKGEIWDRHERVGLDYNLIRAVVLYVSLYLTIISFIC
jgi:hypothetical protein